MRLLSLLLLCLPFRLLAGLLPDQLPQGIEKRLLIAHPTQSTIRVMHTLQTQGLLDLSHIELVGIYHIHEAYDYNQSRQMLDTLSSLHMQLVALKDTLTPSGLFEDNACSDEFEELFQKSAGAFFFGGPDIPPAIYGEEAHPRTVITDPFRHYFEASFLFHLLGGRQDSHYQPLLSRKPDFLINGFCLGMQTMNVATGGTLIQDIPSELYGSDETAGLSHLSLEEIHRNDYAQLKNQCHDVQGSHFHSIRIGKKMMANRLGCYKTDQPFVNSYHHQAVEKLGKGFKVGAYSQDKKVIEALYHKKYPHVFAVQFHPERSEFYHPTNSIKFEPDGESRLLPDWIDAHSMTFHVNYWKNMNRIIHSLEN